MPPPPTADQADHLRLRQLITWGIFAALLVLGVVLWFRFSNRIVPMLDSLIDR
jgi:type VI protein secretion system component VasF